MRILYVIEGISTPGGLERIVIDKMNALAEHQTDLHLLTVWRGHDTPPYPLDARVRRHTLDIPKPQSRLAYIPTLVRVVRSYNKTLTTIKPHIIIHYRAIGALLIGYGHTTARTIFESHGVRWSNNHLWLYPRMERRVSTIVCLTPSDQAEYRRHHRCHDIRVIPNFTTITPIATPDYTRKRCLFVGRLCPEKDIDRLLRLWTAISRINPDWSLDLYGQGQLSTHIHQQITTTPALHNVTLHHHTTHIAAEYARGGILLLSSKTEGFPLSILEAMQCALPVVSVDCPSGPSSLIENGVTGYCTPYHDDQAFVHAVTTLIRDTKLRSTMGQHARQRASQYSRSHIIQQWLDLFATQTHTNPCTSSK